MSLNALSTINEITENPLFFWQNFKRWRPFMTSCLNFQSFISSMQTTTLGAKMVIWWLRFYLFWSLCLLIIWPLFYSTCHVFNYTHVNLIWIWVAWNDNLVDLLAYFNYDIDIRNKAAVVYWIFYSICQYEYRKFRIIYYAEYMILSTIWYS